MNKTLREKIYFSIIEWGVYLSLFTPFILLKSYYFPYVVPKTIFFRIIVDIIFIAYILLVISNRKYLPKFNALSIAVTAFLGIMVLTSITGVDLEKSFWSVFERMTGLLTFFHLYAFFIILSSVFKERKYWERILVVSILVGVIICLYLFISTNPSGGNGGTVGNISFLAAYLLFDIFFAVIFLFAKTGWIRIFSGISLVVMLYVLFFSPELPRGGIGGLFAGIFLLALGYIIFSGKKLLKKLAPVLIVGMILIAIVVSQASFFKEEMADIKDLPGDSRKVVWQIGVDAWQEKFWLGWGPENFNIPFAKYFPPNLPITGDLWYDRVHNVVLDMAVSSGLIGLLSYLSIFGVAIYSLLKLPAKISEKKNIFFPLGMAVLLIVYFLQNLWVFDMISTYMIFFLSLAFVYFLTFKSKEQTEETSGPVKHPAFYFGGALLIVITLFTFYFGNVQTAKSSNSLVMGIISPLEEAMFSFQKSIDISPTAAIEAPEQFSRKLSDLSYGENGDKQMLVIAFESVAIELKKNIDKNPQVFRSRLVLGRHYNSFYFFTQDPEKLEQADFYLKESIKISPNNPQPYWALAQTRVYQGLEEEAIALMQKSIDFDPNFAPPHWYLAMTYRALGKNKLAAQKAEEAAAVGYNWRADAGNLKKVIAIYEQLEDTEKLIELYLLAIELDPNEAQFRIALAVVYANAGDFELSREYANQAKALNPDYVDKIQEFLDSLPQ